MSSQIAVLLVATFAAAACALCGVFLVLRKMAMMADAISHSILPGLVAAYVLAKGPHLAFGMLGALAAGLLTVLIVETLVTSRRIREDAAIGLVFPAMFALGVFVVSKYYSNLHIDADAILYGEIALAPFDTTDIGSLTHVPKSLMILIGLTLLNGTLIAILYKELKISTFDSHHASSLGFMPTLVHYILMSSVALTTVGSFSAVGAILSIALIIVPPATAMLLTHRLPIVIAASVVLAIIASLIGVGLAYAVDVSISGMIASVQGALFLIVFLLSPSAGLLSRYRRRVRQRLDFAVRTLLVHLSTHKGTADESVESTRGHLSEEFGWSPDFADKIVRRAHSAGKLNVTGDALSLTEAGLAEAAAS
jgi:manganese/zinc/iron transport system permease protein